MTEPLFIPYKYPVVRDLVWVMISPSLLQAAPAGQTLVTDCWCRRIYTTHEQHLRDLDENPAPLLQVLSQNKSHRLGIYFESLLRYWLKNILHVPQLQHNVPVFEQHKVSGKRTLGEFDFLFRIAEKQPLQHWEAAVKFYLQKTDAEGKSYWVGPGGRDRLDIKLDRLFQHQLKLSALPQAKECLKCAEAEFVQPAAFIKGYLFYPLDEDGKFSLPSNHEKDLAPFVLSENHQQGWWLRWREVPVPVTATDANWLVLPKSRWLSPMRCAKDETSLMDEDSLASFCEAYFQRQDRPLLVAEMKCQGDAWLEVSRGFVLAPE